MKGSEEMKGVSADDAKEALMRNISLSQWFDLLHVAGFKAGKNGAENWIDQTFKFPGNGQIAVEGNLNLYGCKGLTRLPVNLSVGGWLDIIGCIGLTCLPVNLSIGKSISLSYNLAQKVRDDAKKLKNEGKISGRIIYPRY
jgi:hypothetical protein